MSNRPTHQDSSVRPQDFDLPLSEGFHWESFPDSVSVPHSTAPPPFRDTADTERDTGTQSDSQVQEASGQPAAAQDPGSSQTAAQIQMKVEPNFEDFNSDLRGITSASKRKHTTVTVISTACCDAFPKHPVCRCISVVELICFCRLTVILTRSQVGKRRKQSQTKVILMISKIFFLGNKPCYMQLNINNWNKHCHI